MNKKFYNITFLLLVCSNLFAISEYDDDIYDDDETEYGSPLLRSVIDDDDIYAEHEELHQHAFYTSKDALKLLTRACNPDVSPDSIIAADDILRNDLYKRTNPINQRSLLDLPQFYFLPFCRGQKPWQFYWHYFYNQTTEANFTRDGTTINSYLALDNPTLIEKLQALAFNINVPRVFMLLGNMTLQERRTGVMFEFLQQRGCWYIEGKIPLEYLERNFFLDEEKKRQLEAELLLAEESLDEVDDFGHKHLASDKLGIGDMRLYFGRQIHEDPFLICNAGLLATVPTAFPIIKGITGSHFKKNNDIPPFDLIQILNLALFPSGPDDADLLEQIVTDFLIGAVDKLSANLLETGLGNNGHLGLGVFADTELWVTEKLRFKTHAELEYLLPAPEKRFYINKKNMDEFDEIINLVNVPDPDPVDCDIAFAFLQEQLIATFYPRVYETIIFPGFLFKVTTALTGTMAKNFKVMLGMDSWLQQKEKIGWLIASKDERELARQDIATKSGAFQLKFFGAVNYKHESTKKPYDWCLSFWADSTALSSGIGNDFNLGARFELMW